MTMAGSTGDEVFTATGPLKSVEDRVPMIIVRRKGQTVRFATLLEPVESSGKPVVKSLNFNPSSFTATVSYNDGGEDQISFPENKLGVFVIEQKTGSGTKVVLKN